MPIEDVCIEMRPNLLSGQMLVKFFDRIRDCTKTRIIIKERSVHVIENNKEDETKLILRHGCFGLDLDGVTMFMVTEHHLNYHFNYAKIDLDAMYESGGPHVECLPMVLSFAECKELVALHCVNCNHELVPGCKYNRLREFPSGLFDPSEFFCHDHGTAAKPTVLVPGPTDLFYGLNHIVLNMAVLHCRIQNTESHLYCKRCMWLLGEAILDGGAGMLWTDAIRWVPAGAEPIEMMPRQIYAYPSVTQLMLRLLNTLWPESVSPLCPGKSRALLIASMPNRHEHCMLIDVMETNLAVLRGVPIPNAAKDEEAYKFRYYRACKLYFRVTGSCQSEWEMLQEWKAQVQLPQLRISPYLFLELQRRFKQNANLVPHAWCWNTFEEKLLYTYFFFENEEDEQLNLLTQRSHLIEGTQESAKHKSQQRKPRPRGYDTDAGLDETDDELSDADARMSYNAALVKSYEQELAKRWPNEHLMPSNPYMWRKDSIFKPTKNKNPQ